MAITIPVTTVKNLYDLTEMAVLTNTSGTDYAAKIDAADDRSFFLVDNTDGSAEVTVSLEHGDYSGGADVTVGSVAKGKTALLYVDSAFCKTGEGLALKLSPVNVGTKLSAIQFLPVVNH